MKKLLACLGGFILSSNVMFSLVTVRFYSNATNGKIVLQEKNSFKERKKVKRQTTINYDNLQDNQEEQDWYEDNMISLDQFSPSQFSILCENLDNDLGDIDSLDTSEQPKDESSNANLAKKETNQKQYYQKDGTEDEGYFPRLHLSKVIMVNDLGILKNDKKVTILDAIAKLNPNFKKDQVNLSKVGCSHKGIVWQIRAREAINCVYWGTRFVYFSLANNHFLQNIVYLKDVIKIRHLGVLVNNNRWTILNTIKKLNPEAKIEYMTVSSEGINSNGMHVVTIRASRGKKSIYWGALRVKFYLDSEAKPDESQPGPSGVQSNSLVNENQLLPSSSAFFPSQDREFCSPFNLGANEELDDQEEGNNKQDLTNIITETDLGFLTNNDIGIVFQQIQALNPNLISLNDIDGHWANTDEEGNVFWLIYASECSTRYTSVVLVHFRIIPQVIQQNLNVNYVQVPEINLQKQLETDDNHFINKVNKKTSVKNNPALKLNSVKKKKMQPFINDINLKKTKTPIKDHENDNNAGIIASGLISSGGLLGVSKMTGLSPIQGLKEMGSAFKNSIFSGGKASMLTLKTEEAVELTPLLSGSTATEAVTTSGAITTEVATAAASEGAILETEALTSVALAPETAGLSIVASGVLMITTGLFYWIINSKQSSDPKIEHQYNSIEKYHKPFTYNQLKISFSSFEWKKISQLYQKYGNDYPIFLQQVKKEIANFDRVTGLFGSSSITDEHLNTLIKVIFDNFQTINNYFLSTNEHGWKIVTNTAGNYTEFKAE